MTAKVYEVTVSVGRTTSLGDFESVRNDVQLRATVDGDIEKEAGAVYEKAQGMLVTQVGSAIKRFKRKG